jgi:hypothetical protein
MCEVTSEEKKYQNVIFDWTLWVSERSDVWTACFFGKICYRFKVGYETIVAELVHDQKFRVISLSKC